MGTFSKVCKQKHRKGTRLSPWRGFPRTHLWEKDRAATPSPLWWMHFCCEVGKLRLKFEVFKQQMIAVSALETATENPVSWIICCYWSNTITVVADLVGRAAFRTEAAWKCAKMPGPSYLHVKSLTFLCPCNENIFSVLCFVGRRSLGSLPEARWNRERSLQKLLQKTLRLDWFCSSSSNEVTAWTQRLNTAADSTRLLI